MKKLLHFMLLPFFPLLMTSSEQSKDYMCNHGRRELVGYFPDISLRPVGPKRITGRYYYQQLDSEKGFCDVFARSTTEHLYVMPTYGGGSDATPLPPFTWAKVGPSNGDLANWNLRFDYRGGGINGTTGTIDIANKGCDVCDPPVYRSLGTVNVYISNTFHPTWFTVIASSANLSNGRLVLDHAYLNNKPGAIVFATPAMKRGSGVYDNRSYSLWYDVGTTKWTIAHDDLSPITTNTSFHIRIDPSGKRVKATTGQNIFFSAMFIRNEQSDNNPHAVLLVTPVDEGVKNPHPIGVRYIAPYWTVWNIDGAPMPAGASFNVRVLGYAQYISQASGNSGTTMSKGLAVDIDGAARVSGDTRYFDFSWLNNKPNAQVIITANWNPLNKGGVTHSKYTGVKYNHQRGKWGVFNQDMSAMPSKVSFNVWSPYGLWTIRGPNEADPGPVGQ